MPSHGLTPLTKLLRRMVLSFWLSIIGSWGLIVPRLNLFQGDRLGLDRLFWLYLDVASLSLALLGVFMLLWYKHLIDPRLKRLDALGEQRW
jgi:hypothetical protein